MTARERLQLRLRRALRHTTPRHLIQSRISKQAIKRFADSVGLVYFGHVDQNDDDHRLVRGHTVSATHLDNNYCVGTVRGYDVMLVARNDVITTRDKREQRCHWLIVTIDLHTTRDQPHCYVGHRSRDAAFAASFEQLWPLTLGALAPYSHRFLSDYTIYGSASHAIAIEQMIIPPMAEVIADHFAHASFEVEDNTIYLYIESKRPTEALLEKMLSNGLWLAESIDALAAN